MMSRKETDKEFQNFRVLKEVLDCLDMVDVLPSGLGEDQNIIQVNNTVFVQLIPHHVFYQGLEYGQGISEAERPCQMLAILLQQLKGLVDE